MPEGNSSPLLPRQAQYGCEARPAFRQKTNPRIKPARFQTFRFSYQSIWQALAKITPRKRKHSGNRENELPRQGQQQQLGHQDRW